MELAADCGRCGRSFPLVELVADAATVGRCPRCAEPLLEGYAALAVPLVRELLAAAAAAERSSERLADVAPLVRLHGVTLGAPT